MTTITTPKSVPPVAWYDSKVRPLRRAAASASQKWMDADEDGEPLDDPEYIPAGTRQRNKKVISLSPSLTPNTNLGAGTGAGGGRRRPLGTWARGLSWSMAEETYT